MTRYKTLKKKKRLCISLAVFILMKIIRKGKKMRKRRWWVRPWAAQERRESQGIAFNLIPELRRTDIASFGNFLR